MREPLPRDTRIDEPVMDPGRSDPMRRATTADDSVAAGPDNDGPAQAWGTPDPEASTSLFPEDARDELQSRWEAIQAEFVDEPRHSVEEADRLVSETTKRLADSFAEVRRDLEEEWKRGDDVSTEDLRRALRRYRSFFGRLVSA